MKSALVLGLKAFRLKRRFELSRSAECMTVLGGFFSEDK